MGITDGAKQVAGKAVDGGKSAAVGYWRGLTYPFKGAGFVYFRHPGLIKFWIVPILISMVLLGAAGIGGWAAHQPIAHALWNDDSPAELHKPAVYYDKDKGKPHKPRMKPMGEPPSWAAPVGKTVLEWGVLLGLWAVGILVVMALSNVVAAPFNDLLSEEVEHLVLGTEGPKFSWKVVLRDTVRTIGLEVLKLVIYVVVMGLLFLLTLVLPAIGHVISSVVGFVFTAMYFSLDYIDWPASRRNRSVTYRFGLLTDHFMPMFGFGTGLWAFLFLPLVNLLFMPAAVAGGTLLFLDIEGRGAPAD